MFLGINVFAAWAAAFTPAAYLSMIANCFFHPSTIVTVMSPRLHPNLCVRRDGNVLQTAWNDDTVNFIRQWWTMKHNHQSYLGEEAAVWDEDSAEKRQSYCQSPQWAVMLLIILISTEAGDSIVHMWKLRERLLLLKWNCVCRCETDKIWVFQLSRVHAAGEACRS